MNIKNLSDLTKFFFKESYSFMEGTNRFSYYSRLPIVYIKFIYLMYKK